MGLFQITVREDPDGGSILRFESGAVYVVRAEYDTRNTPGNFTLRDGHMKPVESDNIPAFLYGYATAMTIAFVVCLFLV